MENIKLEAGKFYRTRAGRKAFIFGQNPFAENEKRYWVGALEGGMEECWREDGKYFDPPSTESRYDLVAEWVEPKRIQGVLNFYRTIDPVWHSTREAADIGARRGDGSFDPDRVACIEIDILEGEGLEKAS